MSALVERGDRRFQVWAYSVSMARLRLRSTKSDTLATRVDVLFQNVKAIKLPTLLDGLVVLEADPDEAARISSETGISLDEETTVFLVRSGSFDGFVFAGVCVEVDDEGEYFEPSPLWQDVR